MVSLVPSAYDEDRDVYASPPTIEKATDKRIHTAGAKAGVDYYLVRFTEAMNIFFV